MEHPPFWAAAAVAEFVRERASWRRTQAQRFPDDARNAQSADALEQLAMHVEALPDSDRSVIELIELDAFDDQERFVASEEARRAIARWGFGDATQQMRPRDVLQDLVAITRRARRKPAQERHIKVIAEIPPVPALPGVLWFDDHSSHARHAASRPLGPDRVLTFCGKATDPRRAMAEGAAAWNTPEPACSVCAAAVDRVAETSIGSSPSATDPAVTTLDDIFTIAIAHDTRCQRAEDALYRAAGYRGPAKTGPMDTGTFEDLENEYRSAMIELCAAVARAAIGRLEILAPFKMSEKGSIVELGGAALERFLRPIFEESGIGDRFEVRSGHAVFKRGDDDQLVADLPSAWDPDPTLGSLDEAERAIDAFVSAPNVSALESALEVALAAIEKIGPPPPGTTVDWEASRRILRRTIKAAGQPRGSIYKASIEAPNLLQLFREDVARYTSGDR